jgi:hypothetical protein
VNRKLQPELVWEIDAGRIDEAFPRAADMDMDSRPLSYPRQKTGEWACLKIGPPLEAQLRQLPANGFQSLRCLAGVRVEVVSRGSRVPVLLVGLFFQWLVGASVSA